MPALHPTEITFGLHASSIIPVGAKSKQSIETFIGPVKEIFGNEEALVVDY